MNLIQDDQRVPVPMEHELGIDKLYPVLGIFEVQIEGIGSLTCNLFRKRRLPYLTRPNNRSGLAIATAAW